MPRMSKQGQASKSMFDTTFVEVKLGEKEKEHFEQYFSQTNEELSLEFATFCSKDNKFSVSWDNQNVCFIASATCRDENSVNHNCCISSRSDDWFEAIMLTVYKATVLLHDKAWREGQVSRSWG